MAHIFISYSRKDIDFARYLRAMLENVDFTVWMDEKRLSAGMNWSDELESAIDSCGAFVIVMSPDSQQSKFVQSEILHAIDRNKAIFPVLLVGEPFFLLKAYQYEDMRSGLNANVSPTFVNNLKQAMGIEALSATIDVRDLDKRKEEAQGIFNAAIGLRDVDRQTAWLELMSHCLLLGSPFSGKTTLLQTAILALAEEYTPDELGIILVDSRRELYNYSLVDKNVKNHFGSLPHVLRYVSEPEELDLLEKYLDAELNVEVQKIIRERAEALGIQDVFLEQAPKQRHLLIIVDNYDDIDDFERPKFIEKLAKMLRKYRNRIHLVISGSPEILRNRDPLIKRAASARYSIVLQSVETIRNIGGKVSFYLNNTELPIGRGFIMKSGRTNLFQSARLANRHSDDNYTEELDKQINQLVSRYKEHGKWYFQGSETFLEQCFEPVSAVLEHKPEYEEVEYSDDVAAMMQQILNNAKKADDDKK